MHEVGVTEAALGAVPVLQHLHEGIGLRLHAGLRLNSSESINRR